MGQTATGKTSLAIEIAREFNGEIISADSRQVYRGLDIGTAKVTKKEMKGIPHHMTDVADPKNIYSVGEYVDEAQKILDHIVKNNKVPIVCGGTGMYIDALVFGQEFPNVPSNPKLREILQALSVQELFKRLKERDPKRASSIDSNNKVRLIRALEIIESLGTVSSISQSFPYEVLFIGLKLPQAILHERIHQRIIERFNDGMLEETQTILNNDVSHERLEKLGLEYRYMSRYLRGDISYEDMLGELGAATRKFAKRQNTWFKRNKNIHWFNPTTDKRKITQLVKKFLKK